MMEIIIQVLAAAVGTIAFSVLFSVPKRYYGFCGICGGAGWLVYALLVPSLSEMWIRDSPGAHELVWIKSNCER